MLDGLFEGISGLLNFFYELVPNYAIAIVLLTLTVMVITTPLTMKGTRSMIEMQRLQPQIRKLQQEYKDDRQKLNEELMKFYKENQINPLGGCLPLLIQAPVFSILYWVVRGLTQKANFLGLQRELGDFGLSDPQVNEVCSNGDCVSGFKPKYLDQSADLYQSLLGKDEMLSFGVDLSVSPSEALQEGFITAIPYMLIVLVIGGLSWYQSKQIMGRNKGAEVNPQQKMMMRIGPTMFVFFTFAMPAALGVYFLTSTLWRVCQQTYITRTLYRGEDSLGAQAQKAMAEMRAERERTKASGNGSAKQGESGKSKVKSTAAAGSTDTQAAGGEVSGSKPKPHPRSRKKKKRK